jgi:hypothetical protein
MNGTSCKTTKYKIVTDSVKFHEFDMTHVSKSKNIETASKYYYLNFVKHFDYLESHTVLSLTLPMITLKSLSIYRTLFLEVCF